MVNKKLLALVLLITISLNFISAQYDDEDYLAYLNQLKQDGTLNEELIANFDKLSVEQKAQILSEIDSNKQDFWNQWRTLNGEQKRSLLNGVSEPQRNEFMQKYGQAHGVEFKNLGNEEISFGNSNVIGNKKGYFQMDAVEKYNAANPQNKIASIEYLTSEETSSLIFKKADGNSIDLTTAKDSENGFYFDPSNGNIGKIGSEGTVDWKDPFSGIWNGKGNLKIDTSGENVKISADYNKDKNDAANFAKFTNSKGESYSVFKHPSGIDENGKTTYDLKAGDLTFDKEGNLIEANNMYKNKGKDSWGGFFGENTKVTYNEADFKSAEGSKIMVDLKTGNIKSEVARVAEGPAADIKNYIDQFKEQIGKLSESISNPQSDIQNAIDNLNSARERVAKEQEAYNNANNIFEKGAATAKLKTAQGLLAAQETVVQGVLANNLGLDLNSRLLSSIASPEGLSNINKVLSYTQTKLGAAGDFANGLTNSIDATTSFLDIPTLSSLNPAEGSRINLQLSNSAAKQLKNVEMYGGTLDITDYYGNNVRVVNQATAYGYILPSTFGSYNNYLDGINFNLHNSNYKDGQNIQIYSQNGKLNAIGVGGLQRLQSVNGQYIVNAGGYITYSGLLGSGQSGDYQNVLKADYLVDANSIEIANAFQQQATQELQKLEQQYRASGEGIDSTEYQRLQEIKQKNFAEYNKILNSGDVYLKVSSNKLRDIISRVSGSGSTDINDPIINEILTNTYFSDNALQNQLVERGVTTKEEIAPFVREELEKMGSFIRSTPGASIEFKGDSRNNLYQVVVGNSEYSIDSSAGPFIANLFPVLAGHGDLTSGQLTINTENSRFGNQVDLNIYGGHYKTLKAWLNQNSIKSGIQNTVESSLGPIIKNPASGTPIQ